MKFIFTNKSCDRKFLSDLVNGKYLINRMLLFFALISTVLNCFGQTPSGFFKIENINTTFGQNMPVGTQLIDLQTSKQYLTLKSLPTATVTKISECEILLLNSKNFATAHLKEINVNRSTHQIGDRFGGGIIVSVWKELGVEHGLIASLVNLRDDVHNAIPNLAVWDDTQTWEWFANDLYDGTVNCNLVPLSDPQGAVYMCRNYTVGGVGGWYLPSTYELAACYDAAPIVNQILGSTNGFLDFFYWSSTEYSANEAIMLDFKNGQLSKNSKANPYHVRAVKRF